MFSLKFYITIIFIFFAKSNLFSQQKGIVLNELKMRFFSDYVSRELAYKVGLMLDSLSKSKFYDPEEEKEEFAYFLTKELRKVTKDKHITLMPKNIQDINYKKAIYFLAGNPSKKNNKKFKKIRLDISKKSKQEKVNEGIDDFNYGEIKILPGNIGYLAINSFTNKYINKKYNSKAIKFNDVFDFLKNTNSIIIDLRHNYGGFGKMVAKVVSHFTTKSARYYETMFSYSRKLLSPYNFMNYVKPPNHKELDNSIITFDSLNYYGVKEYNLMVKTSFFLDSLGSKNKYKGKYIYVLSSKATFSAGEYAAYNLRRFCNAKIIGEKTAGAGNGVSPIDISDFDMLFPSVKIIDESNNFNIENIGIKPDIEINADSAYSTAYKYACNNIYDSNFKMLKYYMKPEDANNNFIYKQNISDYLGDFLWINIKLENNDLTFYFDNYIKLNFIYKGNDVFEIVNSPFCASIKFLRNEFGVVQKVNVSSFKGFVSRYNKF